MNTLKSDAPEKVVHVIGALVAGGAERFVSELVQEFRRCGSDITLLVLGNRDDAVGRQMCLDLKNVGVKLHVGPTKIVGIQTVLWYIKKLFMKRPSIIHLHTPNTELVHYIATRIYRLPHKIYRTLHSVRPPSALIMKLAMRANNVTRSIACGDAVYQSYRQRLRDKVITIENGVRFSWPIRTDQIAIEAKNKLGFESRRFHFLIVGRMNDRNLSSSPKGHDILINAWKRGRLGSNDCVLHLLGDGNLRGKITSLVEGDDSVIFHGIQPAVYEWLLAADCFVMPSRYEGLPIAGIEAAGTGVPCIFSSITPLRELKAPQTLWVSVGDSNDLMRAMIQVAAECPKVDAAEVNQFRKRFDIRQTAQKYAEIYSS